MSVIIITNHDENINKIAGKTSVQYEKAMACEENKLLHAKVIADPSRKVSIKGHATMGLAQEIPPDPCNFLKQKCGRLAYSQEDPIQKHTCQRKPRLIPTNEDITKYNNRRREYASLTKNFIVGNIKAVLKMKPKEPEPRLVLEPHGETKRLVDGIEPIYIKLEEFGKTPCYLQNIIKKREKFHQMQKDATGVETPKCRYIRRDEREELLKGLKYNWEELQKLYQGLPILTDTIPKINRKSKLEAELKQLEKDIVLVERHPYIYVYDDNIFF